ncbi:MAG TPA: phosphate ABC transporter substrate-binding protein [Pseudomonadales bacterium]|nr:phosphate ABC transporter substrate-binding protein [Pseudomonadales bacterium]
MKSHNCLRFTPLMTLLSLFLLPIDACAEVVVIVNQDNKIQSLTASQLRDIFLGQSSEFPDGDIAIPADLPDGGPRDEFYLKYAEKSPQQMRAYWLKVLYTGKGVPPQKMPSADALKKLVAKNQGAIGYIEQKDVDNTVKVVPIK